MYEQTRDLTREAEQLRLALSTSRDAAARLEEEAMRLRAENARAGSALVEREKESRGALEGCQSRISRLSSELEQVRLGMSSFGKEITVHWLWSLCQNIFISLPVCPHQRMSFKCAKLILLHSLYRP